MIVFRLPSLGADMDEGTLLQWKVEPGEHIERGEVIAVVDTAKAAVDVECWHSGEVLELLVEPGSKIPVGTAMAMLLEPGENREAAMAQRAETIPEVARQAPSVPEMCAAPPAQSGGEAARVRISPAARKRAAELGIDPTSLTGSGPQGSITLQDIDAAAARTLTVDRHMAMRQAIAAAMSRSKREIPHYYLSETMAFGSAAKWLQDYNAERPPEQRLLASVVLLKAVALALRDYPQLNGYWRDNAFQPAEGIHLGVAITLRRGGLVAPALRDVADRSLPDLMQALSDLVQRARAGSLRSSEMSDATLTVTQLGEQGVDSVFGVIYPPQVALVGVGRIAERPWVQAGALCVMPTVTLSLAADHRVSDGHYGARFLAEVHRLLQSPDSL
ncbi:dihydrolipoamide acetyltransferase family protein [Stutzerimonas frequens]|uniref:dihydrolipoamide acetyltransferase family protein n=1 Tax=Stutzerimonas frequens TaxID=2968969 RepID=UPI0025571249|nr:dihydrolipoamide acetyltransferase family protein [Stutzerimonas frequens]MDL0440558.1 dihydrolipoamide acetyltransferase family protein [Stutzerimonas frequens]